jgi:hypothetical protein
MTLSFTTTRRFIPAHKEKTMKRIITTISLVVFVSSLFAVGVAFKSPGGGKGSIVPSVQAKDDGDDKVGCPGNCSLRTLNGCYGFTFIGTILGLGPIAGIGVTNYDGQGHATTTQTLNINGSGGIRTTVTETYTVNSDCTGSAVITQADGSLTHIDFVIVDHGKEILTLPTDPGLVITGTAKKQ